MQSVPDVGVATELVHVTAKHKATFPVQGPPWLQQEDEVVPKAKSKSGTNRGKAKNPKAAAAEAPDADMIPD